MTGMTHILHFIFLHLKKQVFSTDLRVDGELCSRHKQLSRHKRDNQPDTVYRNIGLFFNSTVLLPCHFGRFLLRLWLRYRSCCDICLILFPPSRVCASGGVFRSLFRGSGASWRHEWAFGILRRCDGRAFRPIWLSQSHHTCSLLPIWISRW